MMVNEVHCKACEGTGVFRGSFDWMGLPGGWVQRCECGVYATDLEAMNAWRVENGLAPFDTYPFALIDSTEGARQVFKVRGRFLDGSEFTSDVTAQAVDEGPQCPYELADSLLDAFAEKAREAGLKPWRLLRLYVEGCGPLEVAV